MTGEVFLYYCVMAALALLSISFLLTVWRVVK